MNTLYVLFVFRKLNTPVYTLDVRTPLRYPATEVFMRFELLGD